MPYFLPGKLLFLGHPRMGSHAIREGMLGYGARIVQQHHDGLTAAVREDVKDSVHITFCVVRNHFEVLVRQFHFAGFAKGAFADFIRAWNRETDYCHSPGSIYPFVGHCEAFLRFEHLERDFQNLCVGVGLEARPLPDKNVTPREWSTREYYDKEAVAALLECYGDEMEQYGYLSPPWEN